MKTGATSGLPRSKKTPKQIHYERPNEPLPFTGEMFLK